MKRIIVIGCPGSGKSTFSMALHEITDIPLYHLDMIFWNADRTTVENSVFLERLSEFLQKDSRPRVPELLEKYKDRSIFVLKSRNQADDFLLNLEI